MNNEVLKQNDTNIKNHGYDPRRGGADYGGHGRIRGESTNGPDLRVVLSPHQSPDSRGDVKLPGYVDLGKLKGNKGDQNYNIPDDVDIDAQGSVVIYCEPFAVVFSVATLRDEEFPFAADALVPLDMTRHLGRKDHGRDGPVLIRRL